MAPMTDRSALRKLASGFHGTFEYQPEFTDGELGVDDVLVYMAADGDHEPYLIATNLDEHVARPIAEMLNAFPDLLDQLDRAEAECERLRAHLHGAEAANAAVAATLVDHVELNGHLEVAEQCHDYLAAEVCRDGDPTGKLRDFVASLYVVIDQFDRQRRSRNWYKVAYTAGKQKLIESALSKVCCKGEPHTCEQEAIAAAEGKTDRLILELAAARPIVEAAKAWRAGVVNEETTGRTRAIADLIVAIDAARGKL